MVLTFDSLAFAKSPSDAPPGNQRDDLILTISLTDTKKSPMARKGYGWLYVLILGIVAFGVVMFIRGRSSK